MARVLVEYSLEVRPGWMVTISATTAAVPLVQAVYRQVLRVGGHPYVLLEPPGVKDLLMSTGSDEQLLHVDPYRLLMLEKSDAALEILSEENTHAAGDVDPARQALMQQARAPLAALSMARITEGRPRCLTLFPTNAYAQDAEMSLSAFEDFVFHACLLDGDEDPADRWRQVSREQQRIVDWLAGKREVRVEGPGTDLAMSIEGRNFVNSDGKRNFPAGKCSPRPWRTQSGDISPTRTRPPTTAGRGRGSGWASRTAGYRVSARSRAKTTWPPC
jgi:aminopeptidase